MYVSVYVHVCVCARTRACVRVHCKQLQPTMHPCPQSPVTNMGTQRNPTERVFVSASRQTADTSVRCPQSPPRDSQSAAKVCSVLTELQDKFTVIKLPSTLRPLEIRLEDH